MKIIESKNYLEKTAIKPIGFTQQDLDLMYKMYESRKHTLKSIAKYFTEKLQKPISFHIIWKYLKKIYTQKNALERFEEIKSGNYNQIARKGVDQQDLDLMYKMFESRKHTFRSIARYFTEKLQKPISESTTKRKLEEIYANKNALERFEEIRTGNSRHKADNFTQQDLNLMYKMFESGKHTFISIAKYFTEKLKKPISEISVAEYLNKIYTQKNALERFEEIKAKNRYETPRSKINQTNTQSITEKSFSSRNELIIQDIFTICDIKPDVDYVNQVKLNVKDKTKVPDYYFPKLDFYFEVFGFVFGEEKIDAKYQNSINYKVKNIPNLKYIDVRKTKMGSSGLLKCATILDTQVCVKKQCGHPLFPDISLQATLKQAIPLLEKFGISLCMEYVKKLQEMNPQQLGKLKKAIERTPVQHQPFPQTAPLNNPNIFRQKSAQAEMITLEQMSMELSQQFKSVQYWLPEEVVAVYFKTPENLQVAMSGQQDQSYNFDQYQQQFPQQNYFSLNNQMARAAMVNYKGDTNG